MMCHAQEPVPYIQGQGHTWVRCQKQGLFFFFGPLTCLLLMDFEIIWSHVNHIRQCVVHKNQVGTSKVKAKCHAQAIFDP